MAAGIIALFHYRRYLFYPEQQQMLSHGVILVNRQAFCVHMFYTVLYKKGLWLLKYVMFSTEEGDLGGWIDQQNGELWRGRPPVGFPFPPLVSFVVFLLVVTLTSVILTQSLT